MATEATTNGVRGLWSAQCLIQTCGGSLVSGGEVQPLYAWVITEVAFVDGSGLLVKICLPKMAASKYPAQRSSRSPAALAD